MLNTFNKVQTGLVCYHTMFIRNNGGNPGIQNVCRLLIVCLFF